MTTSLDDLRAAQRARQRTQLNIVVIALALSGVLFTAIAAKVAWPLRLLVGATDLLAAAVIWVFARQRLGSK